MCSSAERALVKEQLWRRRCFVLFMLEIFPLLVSLSICSWLRRCHGGVGPARYLRDTKTYIANFFFSAYLSMSRIETLTIQVFEENVTCKYSDTGLAS